MFGRKENPGSDDEVRGHRTGLLLLGWRTDRGSSRGKASTGKTLRTRLSLAPGPAEDHNAKTLVIRVISSGVAVRLQARGCVVALEDKLFPIAHSCSSMEVEPSTSKNT
jgi:hypothetical protein